MVCVLLGIYELEEVRLLSTAYVERFASWVTEGSLLGGWGTLGSYRFKTFYMALRHFLVGVGGL